MAAQVQMWVDQGPGQQRGLAMVTLPCHGCGKQSETVYCQECADNGRALCPHGESYAECNLCMIESDMAFDINREDKGVK